LLPPDSQLERVLKIIDLEKGLLVGFISIVLGIAITIAALYLWGTTSLVFSTHLYHATGNTCCYFSGARISNHYVQLLSEHFGFETQIGISLQE